MAEWHYFTCAHLTGAAVPAVPGATSGRGSSACTALLGTDWEGTGKTHLRHPRASSSSHFSDALWITSPPGPPVLLIPDEPLMFLVQVSRLPKGTTRKVTLFLLRAAYQSSGAAVASVMLQCLITSSTAEVTKLLVFHIDANFP